MNANLWALGDSLSCGVVYDPEKGRYKMGSVAFPKLAAERLGLNFYNKSAMGATVKRASVVLQKAAIQPGDIVLIEYGGNDCDFNWREIAQSPHSEHCCHTPMQDFLRQYARLIQHLRNQGAIPVAVTLPPLCAQNYFEFISRGLDSDKILKWLGDVQRIYRWQEYYSHAVLSLASKMNCLLLDIRRTFLESPDMPGMFCQDGIHPNEHGQQEMARAMVDFFKPMMQRSEVSAAL